MQTLAVETCVCCNLASISSTSDLRFIWCDRNVNRAHYKSGRKDVRVKRPDTANERLREIIEKTCGHGRQARRTRRRE